MKGLFLTLLLILTISLSASDDVKTLTSKGNSFANQGKYPQALEQLNQAIEKDPSHARAFKLRGHVYYAMGDYAKAFADLDKVVALMPDDHNVYVDRAIAHFKVGKKTEAKRDIAKALKMKPDSEFSRAVAEKIMSE